LYLIYLDESGTPLATDPDPLAKLERNVGEYNANVDWFIDHRISELVTNYLHDNLSELAISNHRTETEPLNSISLPRLLSWLNDYWIRGREFDVHYADGNFSYKGTNIATIPNELEARLREMTTELQNHFEIKLQIGTLQKRSKELIERAEGLYIEMQNTIIFPIERKSYKTTCKECP